MEYVKSYLEERIKEQHKNVNIEHSHQINFEQIAASLGINIRYSPQKSFAFRALSKYVIILDSRKLRHNQWLDFTRELRHILRHENNSNIMPQNMEGIQ
ncbi:hypothetical protein [Bacillus pumilus]|uniref:hypothetical protein n=1 Tax=Bacillus pumilus TaxID=1408 RepID=UPI0011A07640|nr:hypothetical protein [Bacillus pumilus]MBU8728236.1 hypothetical protein [Bacillus pumilus]